MTKDITNNETQKRIVLDTEIAEAILERPSIYNAIRQVITSKTHKPKYQKGETLWVAETWGKCGDLDASGDIIPGSEEYYYKAGWDGDYVYSSGYDCLADVSLPNWQLSTLMPKEAARMFLKITNVYETSIEVTITKGYSIDAFMRDYRLWNQNQVDSALNALGLGKVTKRFKHNYTGYLSVWTYDFEVLLI